MPPLGSRPGFAPLVERAIAESGCGTRDLPVSSLVRYLDEVVSWNEKIDLTAARTAEELVDLSIADALAIAEASRGDAARWVDVGSGAGAPGLVLSLLLPEAHMTLVEPKDRRVAFLRSTIGKLGLRSAVVERGRSERLSSGSWDFAVSRATLPPPEWLPEGARLARRGVWVLLAESEPPAHPGWQPDADHRYRWPLTGASRRVIRYAPTRS